MTLNLKKYQSEAIKGLKDFLDCVYKEKSLDEAYKNFWEQRDAEVLSPYHDIITGVPNACFKVPTGGGKTLMAAASLKIICDKIKRGKNQLVVWLVPSETILTQTLKNLSDTRHPYREQIDLDFNCGVRVYDKEQLLFGTEFSPEIIETQLSICVLSYDSFSGNKRKEWLKAFQENGALFKFKRCVEGDKVIDGADKISLIQVIRHYNPIIIVDESHHTSTPIRKEMLEAFNPCFILALTATPRDNANIIYYASAYELKKEGMVKLPVIVQNCKTQDEVIKEACILRKNLEENASSAGENIRPIVLFQAESRTKDNNEDRATFGL